MPRFAAFYLPNYSLRGFQYTKGLMVMTSIHVLTLGRQMFNPCDAEYYMYYTPHFILLTCSIPIVSMYFNQSGNHDQMASSSDLDLQCLFF